MPKTHSFIHESRGELTELASAFMPQQDALPWVNKQLSHFEKWMEQRELESLLQMETLAVKRWLVYFITDKLWLRHRRSRWWMCWRKRQLKNAFLGNVQRKLTTIILKKNINRLVYGSPAL